ncbi:hypothetical protein H2198_000424 [Neophaeococcomyces mojaviensis]|uniref:Uncharacterized protein n=1 Tax=Neophaeococcomyces mojaviensis TaxID=3383035 RepID=A0ACC3AKG9_9EURO|nr:hypothetical protein H2198_000424 [Knufia sp. JES_112]
MSQQPIRLGFVGISAGGSWATRSHLPYINSQTNTAGYKVVALQNRSKESAEKAASTNNLPSVVCYDSSAALAADPNVDIVAVSINVPSHFDAIEPALKAKKDIFVEWPLARNLEEAKYLVSLAEENGVRTMVGLQARQNPSIIKAKEMVEAGELGDILGTTMTGYGMISGETSSQDFSYGFPVEAGANLLTIPAGHAMDAMCWVLGEMSDLQASLANMRPTFGLTDASGNIVGEGKKTAHDMIAVIGHLVRGGGVVSVSYKGGMNPISGAPNFSWVINGTKGTLSLEGGMGHIQMWQPKIGFVKQDGKLEDVVVEPVGTEYSYTGGNFSYAVGKAWEAFAGKGDGTVTTFRDALLRHRMLDAIYRSDKNGTRESYI